MRLLKIRAVIVPVLLGLALMPCTTLLSQTVVSKSSSSAAKAAFPVLEDGTPVKLRLGRSISSSDARVGESLELEVVGEIRVGNIIVIQNGGAAFAKVTAAESKKGAQHIGKLEISIDYARFANGDKVALRGVREINSTNAGTDPGFAVVVNPVPVQGKDVSVNKGTEVTAYVSGPVPIDPRKFQQLGGAAPVPASVTANETTELEISTTPPSAEVNVDERLVGSSPLRVIVRNGDHTVTLRAAGYQSYVRTIHVSGGTVNFAAELSKGDNDVVEYGSNDPSTCSVAKGCAESPLAAASRAAKARKAQQKTSNQQITPPQ